MDFDEHRYIRAPLTDTAKARGSTHRGVNLEGAIFRNKGGGGGCQEKGWARGPPRDTGLALQTAAILKIARGLSHLIQELPCLQTNATFSTFLTMLRI